MISRRRCSICTRRSSTAVSRSAVEGSTGGGSNRSAWPVGKTVSNPGEPLGETVSLTNKVSSSMTYRTGSIGARRTPNDVHGCSLPGHAQKNRWPTMCPRPSYWRRLRTSKTNENSSLACCFTILSSLRGLVQLDGLPIRAGTCGIMN